MFKNAKNHKTVVVAKLSGKKIPRKVFILYLSIQIMRQIYVQHKINA